MNSGAGASVIYPGNAGPTYSSGGQYGPRGGVIGTGPGTRETPGGAPRYAPGGGAAASSQSERGGAPDDRPTVSFLGGSEEDEVTHNSYNDEPILLKYLTLPFAMMAAPVKAAVDAARGDPQPGPEVPRDTQVSRLPAPTTSQPPNSDLASAQPGPTVPPAWTPPNPPVRQAVPRAYESVQLQKLERELARRQGAEPRDGGMPSMQRNPTNTSSPAMSIADELAVLQRNAPALTRESSLLAGTRNATLPGGGGPQSDASSFSRTALGRADGIVDRNSDGRIDHWIYRENGRLAREVLDDDFDGRGERIIHYDAATYQVSRVEEDFNHDAAVDSWTEYRDGRIVRRRSDGDYDGVVDSWTYYRSGNIDRHERDTTGDGFRDRIGYYRDGQLEREEQDHDGDGRPEVTVRYDAGEQIVAREEDLDGDGSIDLISHFENGRLVSREILDPAALERDKVAH